MYVRDCLSLEQFLGKRIMVGFFFVSESYATSDLGRYIKRARIGGTSTRRAGDPRRVTH